MVSLTNLEKELGKQSVGVLLGRLKDRGPETGAKFPAYWSQGPNNREMLFGPWSAFGAGTVRSVEGDMVAVVVFVP